MDTCNTDAIYSHLSAPFKSFIAAQGFIYRLVTEGVRNRRPKRLDSPTPHQHTPSYVLCDYAVNVRVETFDCSDRIRNRRPKRRDSLPPQSQPYAGTVGCVVVAWCVDCGLCCAGVVRLRVDDSIFSTLLILWSL